MRGILRKSVACAAVLAAMVPAAVLAAQAADQAAKDAAAVRAKYMGEKKVEMKSTKEDPANLFLDAKPILDVRYRFELVDQDGLPKNADAHTVRTRAGFESGRFYGFGLGFDGEWVRAIGSQDFNSTTNGHTTYPTVADPEDLQVNQLYLVSDGTIPQTMVKVGRQRLIWDNARFIGNVGFRQNEQTFDAARVVNTSLPDTELEYVFLDEVHRIFGTDSSVGKLKMNSHGVRIHYSGLPYVTVTPFALFLDYDSASLASLDSQTYGLLVNGLIDAGTGWKLMLEAEGAHQDDYADNPTDFDAWYYRVEPGFGYNAITIKGGYEVLAGDGTTAFQTPLATLHKFNGFTDKFLTTPAGGLRDLYANVSIGLPGKGVLAGLTLKGGYHRYWADHGSADYGSEWDAGIFKTFQTSAGKINVGAQYVSYAADEFATDTDKLWLTVQFQLDPKPVRAYLDKN